MARSPIIILIFLFASSCDCIQKATGIVLDKETKQPINKVALGKHEKEDSNNTYSKRLYTDNDGYFIYSSTSGGLRNCPNLILYFSKEGYQTRKMTFRSLSLNDTVFLDKIKFNRDFDSSKKSISKSDFDNLTDSCIYYLQNNQLKDITDEQHVEIMMCINTILMHNYKGGHFEILEKELKKKNYINEITKIYTNWVPNRGMGFYFPKLKMEVYGTPRPYAIYNVTE